MLRNDAILLDIALACEAIIRFTDGQDRGAFIADPLTHFAVMQKLVVIGRASGRLSDDLRAQHPQIRWNALAESGDALIRDYDKVDLDSVWNTAARDIPALLTQIRPLIPTDNS